MMNLLDSVQSLIKALLKQIFFSFFPLIVKVWALHSRAFVGSLIVQGLSQSIPTLLWDLCDLWLALNSPGSAITQASYSLMLYLHRLEAGLGLGAYFHIYFWNALPMVYLSLSPYSKIPVMVVGPDYEFSTFAY